MSKKAKKSTYLDKDPTLLIFNESNKTSRKSIGLLKNGNLCSLKPISIKNKMYSVSNTRTLIVQSLIKHT